MRVIRIFISSPGDVAEERDKAEAVIRSLDAYYAGRARLVPVRWENLGLSADASFQEGIVRVLSAEGGLDIAIFIMWSRLGTPRAAVRADGTPYRSGTEQEFDLMLTARSESGGERPHLLAYVREDDKAYSAALAAAPVEQHSRIVTQRTLAQEFIRETFTDSATGQNLRAFHTYDQPVTFADRLRVHLRDVLDQIVGVEAGAVRWDEAPYRGLEVFDVDHEPIFRGREEQVCEILQRLRQCAGAGCAFVVIVGASGSGKSSLARAGVAAHLLRFNLDEAVRRWRCAVFTPGMADGALFAGFTRVLSSAGALPELCTQVDLADFAGELRTKPEGALKLVLRPAFRAVEATTGGTARLLLVLDQFEELYTDRRISAEDREKFLAALEALARSGLIHILATLRSDFYAIAQRDEAFLRLKGEPGHYDLLPPGAAALRLIISEPARLAGLRFERDESTGHTLDARLLEDGLRQPDALPLLQYTLRELYEQRSAEGLLTFAAYGAIGGVEGAIGRRAEAVFTGLPAPVKAAFDDALWSLITVDPDSESTPVRRRAPLPPPDEESPRAILLTALVRERFLTADRSGGISTVSLAHEALLRSWPRLVEWLRENRDLLRIRRRVEEAARLWREKGEHPDYLLAPGLPLVEAESLRSRRSEHFALTEGEMTSSFIDSSSRAAQRGARRRARLRAALIAGFALLSLAASLGAFEANRQRRAAVAQKTDAEGQRATAVEAKRQSESQRVAALEAERRTRLLASKADADTALGLASRGEEALAYAHAVRALELDDQNPLAALLTYRLLVDGKLTLPAHFLTHDSLVTALAFSRDGRCLATGCDDGSVTVTELESGERFALPEKGDARVVKVAFSPDGRSLAYGTREEFAEDSSVSVWEFRTVTKPLLISSNFPMGVLDLAWPLPDRIVAHSGRDWGSKYRKTQVFGFGGVGWHLLFGISDGYGDEDDEDAAGPWLGLDWFATWVSLEPAMLVVHDQDAHSLSWYDLHGELNPQKPAFSLPATKSAPVLVAEESGVAVIAPDAAGDGAAGKEARFIWADPRSRKTGEFSLAAGAEISAISADGERIVVTARVNTILHDRRTGKALRTLWERGSDTQLLTLSRDGASWVAGVGENHTQLGTLASHAGAALSLPVEVRSAALDRTGAWVALTGADKNVRIWPRRILGLSSTAIRPAAAGATASDGSGEWMLETSDSGEGTLFRLDARGGHETKVADLQPPESVARLISEHSKSLTGHAFSPDGKRVAVTYGGWSSRADNSSLGACRT